MGEVIAIHFCSAGEGAVAVKGLLEGGETAVGALGISVSVKSLWGFGGVSVGNEAVMPVCIALLTESSNWSVLRLNSAILLWAITPNSAWSSVKLMATNYLIPQDNKKQ
jgi:hypothetical protein